MALIHFFTLGSLIFGPIFIIYKSTKTATKTTNIYSNLVYGFIAYSMTLFFKMLFVATVVSSTQEQQNSMTMSSVVPDVTSTTAHSTLLFELLKAILNTSDFLALYLVFNRLKLFGGDDSKVIGVGLGWALAENIWSRSVPLYVWTIRQGMEFDWSWLRSGIHANISLFLYLSLATCVFLFSRLEKSTAVNNSRRVFAGVLSLLLILLPIISQLINMVVADQILSSLQINALSSSSTALIIHAILTVALSMVAYKMFSSQSSSFQSSDYDKRGKRRE